MANNDTGVTMSIAGYNQMKSENTRFNMFMDRLFDETVMADGKHGLTVDSMFLDALMRLCFPERYKKRLSYLRQLDTKLAMKELKEKESSNGNESTCN